MHDCLIAFGSNLGDEEAIFLQSQKLLEASDEVKVIAASQPIRTAPVGGPGDQANYLNAAIRLQTSLTVEVLHRRTTEIEQLLGRERRVRWGARKADLDILLFDELESESGSLVDQLIIPHPRMSYRRFVLGPASEIAGDMIHPVSQLTIDELLRHLDQTPQEIIWATRRDPLHTLCYERLLLHEAVGLWKFHFVEGIDEFARLRSRAKLVVWSKDVPPELAEVHFRGPSLRLPRDVGQIETEILAALEAMI